MRSFCVAAAEELNIDGAVCGLSLMPHIEPCYSHFVHETIIVQAINHCEDNIFSSFMEEINLLRFEELNGHFARKPIMCNRTFINGFNI